MAASYRDETAFGDGQHNMAEIAEAIRHKKYGKDVREAIAQGFELMYAEISHDDDNQEDNIEEQLKNLKSRIDRIVLGTDDESIRLVVNKVLDERGIK